MDDPDNDGAICRRWHYLRHGGENAGILYTYYSDNDYRWIRFYNGRLYRFAWRRDSQYIGNKSGSMPSEFKLMG